MTALNLQVAASENDADQQSGGTSTINGAYIRAYTGYHIGFRFLNLTIPVNSTINTATLSWKYTSTSYDTLNIDWYGDDTDDAAAFTTDANNLSSRSKTSATVNTNETDAGTDWRTATITTIIAEIIARAGWTSGNDLAILGVPNGTNAARTIAYDTDTANCAKLDIDYTPPASLPLLLHAIEKY